MSLSRFPTLMPQAVDTCITAGNVLRLIRDGSGDLTYRMIAEMHTALAAAKIATSGALQEGAKQPVSAESFMAGLGGPQTLTDFQTAAVDIEVKAAAMNSRLAAMIATIPNADLIEVVTIGQAPLNYKEVQFKHYVPAAYADPFRASAELDTLVKAFEAVGAV